MKYFVIVEHVNDTTGEVTREIKTFEHTDSEPITPWSKACDLFGVKNIISMDSEEDR